MTELLSAVIGWTVGSAIPYFGGRRFGFWPAWFLLLAAIVVLTAIALVVE